MPVVFFHTLDLSKKISGPQSIEEKILGSLSGKDSRSLCTTMVDIAPQGPAINIYAHDPDLSHDISISFNDDIMFHGGWSSSRVYSNEYGAWKAASSLPHHEVIDDIRKYHIADGEEDRIYREKYTKSSALRKSREIDNPSLVTEHQKYFSNAGRELLEISPRKRHLEDEPSRRAVELAANEYHVEARIYNVRAVILTAEQVSASDGIILQLKALELLEKLENERRRVAETPDEIEKLVQFEKAKRAAILKKIDFLNEKIAAYKKDLEHVSEKGGKDGYPYNQDLVYAFAHKRMKFRKSLTLPDDRFAAFADNEFAKRNRTTWLRYNIGKLESYVGELFDELTTLPSDEEEIAAQIKEKLAQTVRAEIYDKGVPSLEELPLQKYEEYIAQLKQLAATRDDVFLTLLRDNVSDASIKKIIFENELLSPEQKMRQILFYIPAETQLLQDIDIFAFRISEEILSEMAKVGFDINAKIERDGKQLNALCLAASKENSALTNLLLARGAIIPEEARGFEKSFIDKIKAGKESEDEEDSRPEFEETAYLTDVDEDESEEMSEGESEEMSEESEEESEEKSGESEEESEESEEESRNENSSPSKRARLSSAATLRPKSRTPSKDPN